MTLSNEAVTSFQKLYEAKCGIQLSYEAAQVAAINELRKIASIFKALPDNRAIKINRDGNENAK